MEFLFMSLGSSIFWIVFVLFYLFCGTISLKLCATLTYSWLLSGESLCEFNTDRFKDLGIDEVIFIFFTHYVWWPIVLISVIIIIIVRLVYSLLQKSFRKLFIVMDKLIPNIKIEKSEKK